MAFIAVYYLHVRENLEVMMLWTLPRLVQTPLALMMAAAAVCGPPDDRPRPPKPESGGDSGGIPDPRPLL
jgi:hypothetical protein